MKHSNNNHLFIRQLCITVFLIGVIALSVFFSFRRYILQNDEMFYNNARVMVTDEYQLITSFIKEQSVETKMDRIDLPRELLDKDSIVKMHDQCSQFGNKFPYCIIDRSGKVVDVFESTYYKIDERLNLNEVLSYDNTFADQHKNITKILFPIIIDGKMESYVMFFLPVDKVWGSTKLGRAFYVLKPLIFGVVIVLMYLCYHLFELKHKIINPIEEISDSAYAIIEGNYDREVRKLNRRHMRKDEVGNLTYGFELMRDELKERIRREEKLKQSQKELISCVSHDLKTPISTIKAYSEGMRDGIANNEEKRTYYADVIARKTEVLSRMISDLLDHSNAELNELTIYKEEVYIRLYLKKIMEEMELYVRQRTINFTYELIQDNLLVMMDERRITQVLYNLVENAIKYMDKEVGRIHVQTKYEPEQKQVRITIKDNGIGISMEDVPYMFNKFYRSEKSRNMSIPGCGLGLSICKYIVEQHGGEITCISKKEVGTKFTFTIKIYDSQLNK